MQDFEVGTRAIVWTQRFRCLAVLDEDRNWREVYGEGRILDVVRVIDSV